MDERGPPVLWLAMKAKHFQEIKEGEKNTNKQDKVRLFIANDELQQTIKKHLFY